MTVSMDSTVVLFLLTSCILLNYNQTQGQIQFNSSTYSTSVYEDVAVGTELDLGISAADLDGVNSVTYSINSTDGEIITFSIDSTSGVISTVQSLDYEAQQAYQFSIRAIATGLDQATTSIDPTSPNVDTANVTITVLDVNDNTPTFDLSAYNGSVSENAGLGMVFLLFTATDTDSGTNARLSYSIVSGNDQGAFSFIFTTGLLSVAGALDRETTASYNLTVQVADAGNPSLSSRVNAIITIDDENDNSPVFSQDSYTVALPYNELEEWSTVVTATDRDIGSNAAITYSITGGDTEGVFTIDADSGNITVAGMLDPEESSSFNLTVQATDGGTSQNRAQAIVMITVGTSSSTTTVAGLGGSNRASHHSVKLLLYPLLASLALLVSAAFRI